jgi:TPP-dependent pyruvate/acetoin dehydrogenase alpha subunit
MSDDGYGGGLNTRRHDLGSIPGLANEVSSNESLELFRSICVNRYFELETAQVHKTGVMKSPIYLSVGQEQIPAAIATASKEFMIFAQHRAHSYYLSFGGSMRALIDELLHRATGCAGGMGGSASIHDPSIPMFGHSGLMGDQVPIAVGAALASGKRTLAVFGDAAAEEDYVQGAMAYAASKRAPVLFICEDNDLSILTRVSTRRSWSVVDVAQAYGMNALDIGDDPWLIAHHVSESIKALPTLLNIRTCRQLWHAGTGTDDEPEWNRFDLIKDQLRLLEIGSTAEEIEVVARRDVKKTWQEQLQKQLVS